MLQWEWLSPNVIFGNETCIHNVENLILVSFFVRPVISADSVKLMNGQLDCGRSRTGVWRCWKKKKELEPKLMPNKSLLLSIAQGFRIIIKSTKAHFGFMLSPTLFE